MSELLSCLVATADMPAPPGLRWLLYRTEHERFPYHLLIEEEPGRFLCFDVQDKWPGPGKGIFCLARPDVSEEQLPLDQQPVDSCGIVFIKRYGRKLTVLLNRKIRKRSWFLTVEKQSKTTPGKTYKQTFWITQSSATVRRGGAYLSTRGKTSDLAIVRDSRERYGYRFPRHEVVRETMPVGDYALKNSSGEIIAVVERKTRDQFLADIGTLEVLRARLLEMTARYPHCALVVEANYSDLVNPKKARFYSAGLVADVIAELSTGFPGLQIAFCSNRRFAAEWVERYFTSIARLEGPPVTTSDRAVD
ncbi:MAG: ERCC4 domain-containing protein [candidate division WOR-3 bacterium]